MKTKFKTGELIRVSPNDLMFAPWNPERRTDATDKKFQELVTSIRIHGQFMPVLINEHGLVIDGNRRVAACRVLGIPVECVVKGKVDAFTIYEVVNNCRLAITGAQVVEIFAKEQRALSKKQRSKVERLADAFGGIGKLNEFIDSQYDWETVRAAETIRSFTKKTYIVNNTAPTPEAVWLLVNWCRRGEIRPTSLNSLYYRYPDFLGYMRIDDAHSSAAVAYFSFIWREHIAKNVLLPFRFSSNGDEGHLANVVSWLVTKAEEGVRKELLPKALAAANRERQFHLEVHGCDTELGKFLKKQGIIK